MSRSTNSDIASYICNVFNESLKGVRLHGMGVSFDDYMARSEVISIVFQYSGKRTTVQLDLRRIDRGSLFYVLVAFLESFKSHIISLMRMTTNDGQVDYEGIVRKIRKDAMLVESAGMDVESVLDLLSTPDVLNV